jgi:hypothetical protein
MAIKFIRIGPPWWVWLLISLGLSLLLTFISPVCTAGPEGNDCTTLGMILLRAIF